MSPFFLHGAIAWTTLALVAIPIIIHLIHRRRFLRLDWAAMEFLLEALRRSRRRLQLEQLLLLLLRILMVILLGLFIARPILSQRGLSWVARFLQSEDRTLVLDDSFSMSHEEAGRTLFARAVDAVGAQIRRTADRGGDRLTVVRGSRPRAPLVRGVSVDRERSLVLAQSIGRLSPTDGRLPLAEILDEIAERSASDESGRRKQAKSIAIVTDLRAADWTDGRGAADEPLRRALVRASGDEETPARLVILDVGSDASSNVAVVDVSVEGGKAIQDVPVDVRVTVRNFGSIAARGLGLRLRYAAAPVVGGDQASFSTALGPPVPDIPAGQSATLVIPCTFRSPGHYGAVVELTGAPDALPGDNVFPLVVEVVAGTDVLVVSGEPSSEPFEGESDFLEQALAPAGGVTSGVRPNVVAEENAPRGALEQYALVFTLNVHALPAELLAALGRYVRDGGALVVFLGDQVDGALWNRQMGPVEAASVPTGDLGPEEARGLLPARLGEVVSTREAPLGISFSPDHPYFRLLGELGDLVSMIRFQGRFELEPIPTAQVLARFTDADGSPGIVEHAFGRGRVILFASSADLEWNDWARNPTYLTVLQEIVSAVARSRAQRAEPLAGVPLLLPVDIGTHAQEARFRGPGFPTRPERTLVASPAAEPGSEGEGGVPAYRFVIDDTHEAGLYALQLRSTAGEPEWRQIAVRRDPRESDLARMTASRLRELYPEVELTVLRDATSLADSGFGSVEASDLLLWGFLALLFLEAFLARIFAHHPAATSRPSRGGPA